MAYDNMVGSNCLCMSTTASDVDDIWLYNYHDLDLLAGRQGGWTILKLATSCGRDAKGPSQGIKHGDCLLEAYQHLSTHPIRSSFYKIHNWVETCHMYSAIWFEVCFKFIKLINTSTDFIYLIYT